MNAGWPRNRLLTASPFRVLFIIFTRIRALSATGDIGLGVVRIDRSHGDRSLFAKAAALRGKCVYIHVECPLTLFRVDLALFVGLSRTFGIVCLFFF